MLLAALVGAGFTALVQSSSATTGILIVMASQGLIGLEPAIALARDGYMVRPHMVRFWTQEEPAGRVQHIEYLRGSPATAKTYLNTDGSLKGVGDVIKNPDTTKNTSTPKNPPRIHEKPAW